MNRKRKGKKKREKNGPRPKIRRRGPKKRAARAEIRSARRGTCKNSPPAPPKKTSSRLFGRLGPRKFAVFRLAGRKKTKLWNSSRPKSQNLTFYMSHFNYAPGQNQLIWIFPYKTTQLFSSKLQPPVPQPGPLFVFISLFFIKTLASRSTTLPA